MYSPHVKTRMETKGRPRGFTLVELLVVISIIAVLLTILIPSLQAAKQQAQATLCLAHQRSLSIAYVMYTDDNNGQLVGAYSTMPGTGAPHAYPWVCPPMLADGTYFGRGSGTGEGGDPATLEDRLRGIREGKFFPYVDGDTDIYHCPGDKRMYEGTYIGNSQVYKLYISYGLQSGLNSGQPGSVTRLSAVPRPSETYAFVETYYDGWVSNEGVGFVLDGDVLPGAWWSVIAMWHKDSGTLSFVDGHAERIVWQDERTLDMEQCRAIDGRGYQPDNPDLQYMFRHHAIADKWDFSWMIY